ncbi:MAG: ArnT family glycosyltransferase [Gammaproteobacteria bacterium]
MHGIDHSMSLLENKRNWLVLKLVFLVFAFWIGFMKCSSLPLEHHDVYVIGTAQEMQQNGDWIVPIYRGQPRLNKPPMNYWITGLVSWASGASGIKPWHGLFPSAIAGVGLLWLLLRMGESVCDRKTAAVGAVIYLTSLGFFKFSHSARPDMLYAFFCTAGYAAFYRAYVGFQGGSKFLFPTFGMWLLFAAATLTKGPHVPGMILAACIVFLMLRNWRAADIYRMLQPVAGVVLMAVLAAPWWWLVKQSVGAETMASSQLSGSLLTFNWRTFVKFYYLYSPWFLAFPWILLAPYMLYRVFRRDYREIGTQFLSLLIAAGIIVFSFGPQVRLFYMLPFLVPICLLLASSLIALWGEDVGARGRKIFNAAVIAHWFALSLLLGWIVFTDFRITPEVEAVRKYSMLALAVAMLAVSAVFYRRRQAYPWLDLAAVLIAFYSMATVFGATSLFWGEKRIDEFRMAKNMKTSLPETVPIASFKTNPAVYWFFTERPVTKVNTINRVESFLAANGGRAALIVKTRDIPQLSKGRLAVGENCVETEKRQMETCVMVRLAENAVDGN